MNKKNIQRPFLVNKVGLDYLSLSAHGAGIYKLTENKHIENIVMIGEPSVIMQYAGWTLEDVFWGLGTQKDVLYGFLKVPGYKAGEWYEILSGLTEPETAKCTRLDIQITVPCPEWYNAVQLHLDLIESETRKCKIVGNDTEGYTVYLGSRTSERYVRIYEKFKRNGKEQEKFLRFEVEYTGTMSNRIWFNRPINEQGLLKSEVRRVITPNGRDIVPKGCLKSMADRTLDYIYHFIDGSPTEVPSLERSDPNTFQWLEGSVSSAIARLAKSYYPEDRQKLKSIIRAWKELVDEAIDNNGESWI